MKDTILIDWTKEEMYSSIESYCFIASELLFSYEAHLLPICSFEAFCKDSEKNASIGYFLHELKDDLVFPNAAPLLFF